MNVREFLRKVHLFANLSEKNLKRVERLCKTRSYRAGEHIVSQGGRGEGLFVITSGKVRIVKKTNDGTELEIATHGPGEFFGEFSVLDGAPRSADVVAAEDTECLVIISWDFRSLMQNHPSIALEILPVVVKRFRETNAELLRATAGGTPGS